MILLVMHIETGSDPRGLWRLRTVHRLVGLSREAGVSGLFIMRRSQGTEMLANDQRVTPEFPDRLGGAAAVSTSPVE